MKIAFVNDSCEHLGVEYISALLKKNGHQTKLFVDPLLFDDEFITVDFLHRLFDRKQRLVSELKHYRPDLIGISVVSSSYQWALSMARMIKQEMDVPIIFGGIHPTSVPERVIKNDFVDMVCVGEGEYPMLELADSMDRGSLDTSIKNLWFKKDGQVIANEVRPLIEDLDSLPLPDKDLHYSASPHFSQCCYVMAERGCFFSCSFCCNSYLNELYEGVGRRLRQRSVKNVIQELSAAKLRGKIKVVFFADDCFGRNIRWLEEFAREYGKKINIGFSCQMHPGTVSASAVKYLKAAGCAEIEIGIQSWNEEVREGIFQRKIDNQSMEEAMRMIKREKINLVTGDLIGYPGYREGHVFDAVGRYHRIKPERSYIFILKYYPNALITQKGLESGDLSKEEYEDVLEGRNAKYLGRDTRLTDRSLVKFLLLFFFSKFLPEGVLNFIVRRRIYRRFPGFFSPSMISALNNVVSPTLESRLNQRVVWHRYSHFLFKGRKAAHA